MPRERTRTETSTRSLAIAQEAYAAFIRQVELTAIWLHEAHVQNRHGPMAVDDAQLHIEAEASWEPEVGGFRALHHYTVVSESGGTVFAEIDITFGIHFASAEPMTDALFSVFSEVNLPVNTWPYLREFVATTMGRMNWLPFTLPALKRGIDRPVASGNAAEGPAAPSRSRIRRALRA